MTAPGETSDNQWATKLRRSRLLNIVLAVVVVFLGIVVFAQSGLDSRTGSAAPTASTSAAPPENENPFARNDPDDPMAIGSPDAPVVLVEWADLRCPYCAVFSRDTLPAVIEEYVDTGEVRIEFHDVSFFGEQSESAAVAVRAAARQGRAVEYIDAVFAAAPESGHADLPPEKLIAFAEQVGVADIAAFTADLDDPQLLTEVQRATAAAQQVGVSAVPFFYAGGRPLSGAQTIEAFRTYLDAALEQAR